MPCQPVVCFLVMALLQTGCTAVPKKTLYIGGIFPMEGGWAGGKGCRPAVDMALEDVNAREDILPDFNLEMVARDSGCMADRGRNVLNELVNNEPTKVMLLGPGCSSVSTSIAQDAPTWNLVVLSYGSSSPVLSNRERFPTFFRTHPSATLHNPTRVELFKRLGWTRIATIQETAEVFTLTIEDLERRAQKEGIEIAVRTSFLRDPTNAVRKLRRQDPRIIVGLFYEDTARRVFCEVYKQKLYGPKYVWFIIGWYPDNWFREEDKNINCTADQLKEALEGHFTTEALMFNLDNTATVSGMTPDMFKKKVEQRIHESNPDTKNPQSVTGYLEAPLAYDAVWALALALNKTQHRLQKRGTSLEDFSYDNDDIKDEIYDAINATDFTGVSGRVAFNSVGDRIAWTQVERMWDGNYTVCGFYDISSNNLTCYSDVEQEKWLGGKRPHDRPVIEPHSAGFCIAVDLLASQGILVAGFLLLKYAC